MNPTLTVGFGRLEFVDSARTRQSLFKRSIEQGGFGPVCGRAMRLNDITDGVGGLHTHRSGLARDQRTPRQWGITSTSSTEPVRFHQWCAPELGVHAGRPPRCCRARDRVSRHLLHMYTGTSLARHLCHRGARQRREGGGARSREAQLF
jgi:hypothetical protein